MSGDHHQIIDMTGASLGNELDVDINAHDETRSINDIIEGPPGNDQDPSQSPNRNGYHRHTPQQIQEMEALFREYPHADDKKRKDLAREMGLEPLQVKFWFQNKRTQVKSLRVRYENTQLKTENEKLHAENMVLKETLSNATCLKCKVPAALGEMSANKQHLLKENDNLKREINRMSVLIAKHLKKNMLSSPHLLGGPPSSF